MTNGNKPSMLDPSYIGNDSGKQFAEDFNGNSCEIAVSKFCTPIDKFLSREVQIT